MMNEIHIRNLDDPSLQPYRTLRQAVEHRKKGIFVAEGEKVVRRLLESDVNVVSTLLTPQWLATYRNSIESRRENIEVFVAEKKLLETIVGFPLHQGIMAVGKIPMPGTLEEILARNVRPHFFVAVDGLTNSENLGVLVRNCAAFGVQALLVGETSSSPYLRRAVRNSMGAVFKLPVIECSSLTDSLVALKQNHDTRVIAAHPHAEQKTPARADLKQNCCLVFGSEGNGVSSRVLECCDDIVAVPMENSIDSLNVASASAVFLYEVRRQRQEKE
ncbi:MAG: RNA methyltransferase [Ignavibacteriales bacterium]|nr:RNA methyltransferase [Ignavibacteriales bacterium]